MAKTAAGLPVIDLYARLSFAANGETINVDDQVDMGTEEVERRACVVGEVFKDNSLSAWNPKVVRPQWNQLMERLESGACAGVWVLDITRFSRKMMEGERLVELAAGGARVLSHAGEYDLTTADGRRHFRESMVAAAGESDKISERVKRGNLRRARKGRMHGGTRAYGLPGWEPAPPGWEQGDPRSMTPAEVVAAERAVIRECYDRIFAGESMGALVTDLHRRGVRGVLGGGMSRSWLTTALHRPAVAGLLEHKGQIMGEIAGVEPIVSREEWERMCGLLESRRTGRPVGDVHMLSGTIRCGQCGKRLFAMVRAGQPPNPDGSTRREYRCKGANPLNRCGRRHVDAWSAEQYVDEAMRARLGDPRRAVRLAAHLGKVSKRRAVIEAEIAGLQESADELATKTAKWGMARVDKAMEPILTRIDALTTDLAALEAPAQAETAAVDAVAAWDDAMARRDLPALRAMVKRAFPLLTLGAQNFRNDHGPHRMLWEGAIPAAA